MTSDITLLTASIPERTAMLCEALRSVGAQTAPPAAHFVGVDWDKRGAAWIYNQLAAEADTEWVTFLDDDDLLDPDHLEVLGRFANANVEVVYSGCRPEGHRFAAYNQPFHPDVLLSSSIVPITAMVRTDWFRKVGGFRTEWGYDWELWKRLLAAGARFHSTQLTTWTYRRHGRNLSYGELGNR